MPAPHLPTEGLEVADILARYGEQARARFRFSSDQLRTMRHLATCRTAALGGHLDICDHCGFARPSYNSCRDRHCPKCQSSKQARWLAARLVRILPVSHYHVVFTLPGLLRPLVKANRRLLLDLLFHAASDTLATVAADPKWLGGQLGVTVVLHTWTRDLRFHPHVHCVVTAGGLARDGQSWLPGRSGARILFPVGALRKVFRGKFLDELQQLVPSGNLVLDRQSAFLAYPAKRRHFFDRLYRMRWNVYAKRPFAGSRHVFAYLGRYTHRVAISNQRLVALDDAGVHFVTKDKRVTRLEPTEFIRRFLDHVLPRHFVKIRHYGLYASANVHGRLEVARALLPPEPEPEPEPEASGRSTPPKAKELLALDWRQLLIVVAGVDFMRCPRCGVGTLERHDLTHPWPPNDARGPP